MSAELAESYASLEKRVQEKTAGLSKRMPFSPSYGRPTAACTPAYRCANVSPRF
ncbi:Nitrate/nitrite sensor protein narX [Kluyvera cryocrescens]|uniref:Nitrate/nitrite sensor protein narX n=1 Tax=Kluyvera cryocrescens TaxID=580 RepID=A0A485BLS3_KLUCR|nr:Nitrate/nitrite sensor protein narX [Kluyvera cryocrescens]